MLASLVSLVLLTAPPANLPRCENFPGRVELTPGFKNDEPVACVSPNLVTTFLFTSDIASFEFPDLARFAAPRTLERPVGGVSFMPLEENEPGQRFPVRVRFADGKLPEVVTLWLVFHPAVATRQVIVTREARSAEELLAEVQQLRAENERLRGEAHPCHEASAAPPGLAGVLYQNLYGKAGLGHSVLAKELTETGTALLEVSGVEVIRSDKAAALRVRVENGGDADLTIEGAALINATDLKNSPTVWQQAPIPAGGRGDVYLQLPMTPEQTRGVFTLSLWSTDRRVVKFGNVTFP